jgi:hypothetical protein
LLIPLVGGGFVESTFGQRLRVRIYLTLMGLKRRMTLGARGALIDGDKIFPAAASSQAKPSRPAWAAKYSRKVAIG